MHLLKRVKSFQHAQPSQTRLAMSCARSVSNIKPFCQRSQMNSICQTVDGLSSVSLSRSNSKTIQERIYTGNDCEWIDLNKVG